MVWSWANPFISPGFWFFINKMRTWGFPANNKIQGFGGCLQPAFSAEWLPHSSGGGSDEALVQLSAQW
jgi:hypothetical protein